MQFNPNTSAGVGVGEMLGIETEYCFAEAIAQNMVKYCGYIVPESCSN